MKTVKTRITREDQDALLKFLESDSGRRVVAWLYEDGVPAPRLGADSHEFIFHSGMVRGHDHVLFNMKSIPFADLETLNQEEKTDGND